ncbi:MAG: PAS domain S-box protein, partial [Salinivirgaceae bacterium]
MKLGKGKDILRKRAEELLAKKKFSSDDEFDDTAKLIEELSIHQIELEMQNEELQRSQQQLTMEREKYRQLYDNAPVPYITINPIGNIIDLNFAAADFFGKPREVFNFNSIFPFLHEKDKSTFRSLVKQTINSKDVCAAEIGFINGADELVSTKINCRIFETHDQEIAVQVIITDMVAEKQRHVQELNREKEKLREVFDNAKEAILLLSFDQQGHPSRFIEANIQATKLLNRSRADLLGTGPLDSVFHDKYPFILRAGKELLKHDDTFFEMFHYTEPEGEGIPIEVDTHSFKVGNEHYGVIKIHDIRERKASEVLIREKEQRYRLLAENIHDTIILADLEFNIKYLSPNVEKLTGFGVTDYLNQPLTEFLTDESYIVYSKEREKLVSHMSDDHFDYKDYTHSFVVEGYHKSRGVINIEVLVSFYIENDVPKGIIGVVRDVTDRVEANMQMQEINKRLELAMEVGNLGWWDWNYEKNNLITSDKKADILGYDPKKYSFSAQDFIEMIHPDDYDAAMQAMRDHLTGTKESYAIEYRLRMKNGNYKWLFDKGRIIERTPDGAPKRLMGVVFDISARKENELKVIESEQKLHALLANLDDMIFVQDEKGRYLHVWINDERKLFVQKEQIIGKQPQDIFDAKFSGFVNNTVEKAVRKFQTVSAGYKAGDGENEIYYNARVTPIRDHQTGDILVVSLVRDITQRKTAEKLVLEKNKELKELNATKDKFFSIIAHDLKNPFNAILGFSADLLKKHQALTVDKRHQLIESVYNSAKQSYSLLENLLVWTRMQSNRMPFNPDTVNLCELIQDNITLYSGVAEKKDIGLSVRESDPTRCQVKADRDMLNTVFRNLISNALKYTYIGGKVEVGCMPAKSGEVQVFVRDNGVGIKKEIIPNLFKIEESYSTIGTEKEAGTGLGLVLVKEFV